MASEQRIQELEAELNKTSYNKRTQHHVGLIKAQIAKLKEKVETTGSGKGKGKGFGVKKTGDATVILVGYPSVGKSTLLVQMTSAKSKVAAYAFTTLDAIPGVFEYKNAKIQLVDVPGLVEGAAAGTGRGKEVLSTIRIADLILIMADTSDPEMQLNAVKKEIYYSNLRLNEKKPDVRIKRLPKGGLQVASSVKLTKTNIETIKAMLKELKVNNAEVLIREDISQDQLIDAVEGNRLYIPGITILNKIDLISEEEVNNLVKKFDCIPISADSKVNLDFLKEKIFEKLEFTRIYMKRIGKVPDMKVPLIMKKGCTISNVCEKVHREFVTKFRFARVWGKSAKFPGQRFMLEHALEDGDIIEIHLK
jgi:small GTP-binding protein